MSTGERGGKRRGCHTAAVPRAVRELATGVSKPDLVEALWVEARDRRYDDRAAFDSIVTTLQERRGETGRPVLSPEWLAKIRGGL